MHHGFAVGPLQARKQRYQALHMQGMCSACRGFCSAPVCSVGQYACAGERANEEREQALNQLLSEMDGFTPEEGIVFVAATNRADLLDPALMRAGRFDRKIRLNRPDAAAREEILRVRAPVNSCMCLSLGSGVYLPSCLLGMLAPRDTRKVMSRLAGLCLQPAPVLHTNSLIVTSIVLVVIVTRGTSAPLVLCTRASPVLRLTEPWRAGACC